MSNTSVWSIDHTWMKAPYTRSFLYSSPPLIRSPLLQWKRSDLYWGGHLRNFFTISVHLKSGPIIWMALVIRDDYCIYTSNALICSFIHGGILDFIEYFAFKWDFSWNKYKQNYGHVYKRMLENSWLDKDTCFQ